MSAFVGTKRKRRSRKFDWLPARALLCGPRTLHGHAKAVPVAGRRDHGDVMTVDERAYRLHGEIVSR